MLFLGKLDKHCIGMCYLHGKLEATSEVTSVPLGQKRKSGRPKKMPHCLTRSPPVHLVHSRLDAVDIVTTETELDDISDIQENEEVHQLVQEEDPAIEPVIAPPPPQKNQVLNFIQL
jgi:hypothetical protein